MLAGLCGTLLCLVVSSGESELSTLPGQRECSVSGDAAFVPPIEPEVELLRRRGVVSGEGLDLG